MTGSACWRCGHPADSQLFCPECRTLQSPPVDYYSLFGIPKRLGLDPGELQKRFYELSRELHPDRFMRKDEREREYSLEASSLLNDAYRALKNRVSRAEYVLKREGFDIGEQRSKNVPPELLEEVFALNEALEEMRGGDESARPQLIEARENFTAMLEEVDSQLETLFGAWDASGDRAELEKIRGALNRRKYIQNLVDEVVEELDA